MDNNPKTPISPGKKTVLKLFVVAIIVMTTIAGITIGIPTIMDIPTSNQQFDGFPTYTCTTPFDITSCDNKTAISGHVWANNGGQAMDIEYTP